MTTRTWIRNLFARTPRTVRKAAARRRPTLETLEDRTLLSNAATAGDLITAIQNANTAGAATTITLAANATFDFASADNTTDGGNALPVITGNVTIVGNGATIERTGTTPFRLFDVAGGGSLTLQNLTLTGGLAQGAGAAADGGAIYSSGTLSLTGVTVLRNTAQGNNGSDATVHNNPFTAGNGVSAYGGGVCVAAGAVTLSNNIIEFNKALGGKGENGHFLVGGSGDGSGGGDGGNGGGGGLYVASGTVSLSNNHLLDNSAAGGGGGDGGSGLVHQGGKGGHGGSGSGGGLYVANGSVSMNTDILFGNHAAGAPAGGHGNGTGFADFAPDSGAGLGGGLYVAGGSVTLSGETIDINSATGGGADKAGAGTGHLGVSGGAGSGGGLYAAGGAVVLNNDTFEFNSANGGNGFNGESTDGNAGGGGQGTGGALCVAGATVTMSNNTLALNNAVGGAGGNGAGVFKPTTFTYGLGGSGGAGSGGGLYVAAGTVTLCNDTITGNSAQGGNGGNADSQAQVASGGSAGGTGGDGKGGGVYLTDGTTNLANTLIANNTVTAGAGGAGVANHANGASGTPSAPDVSGNASSSDHDLVGDGSGSNLINLTNGDQVGSPASPIDPKLDPLGLRSNGGPTDTVLLEPGSPAFEAGDSSAAGLLATDQRGYARIVGDAVDIGAYETGAVAAATDLSVTGTASPSVLPGGLITYTLTVTNSGATAQNNVTLTDALPAHTTFVSWTPPNDWVRSAPSAGSHTGTASAWIGSLPANTSATFTLVIRLDSDTAPFVAVSDTASVGPVTGDPTPSNNTVSLTTPLSYFSTASNVYELTYDVGLANLNGGAVSIALAANTAYDFTSPNNSTDGGNALPVITGNVTIAGNGATIERTGTTPFRLFDVAAGGSLTLENLTLKGGRAQGTGAAAQGGAIYNSGTLTLTNDTLSGNNAQGGAGGNDLRGPGGHGGAGSGGGLYVAGGTVTLTNDTLSGNNAQGGAGGAGAISVQQQFGGTGGAGSGGGLYVAGGTVTLTNDTLSGNNAQGGKGGNGNLGGFGGDASGGGVYLAGGTTNLANTLIAQNTVTAGAGGAHVGRLLGRPGIPGSQSAPDVSGNVNSSDHDLVGDGSSSNLSNLTNGDKVGSSASPIDPKLGPLQNNGGPTQTMALLPGSPAISAVPANTPGTPSTDQRGFPRNTTFATDIGAFEVAIRFASPGVTVNEGSQVLNTVTISDPLATPTASVGSLTATPFGPGVWIWSDIPPDGPNSTDVTITFTEAGQTAAASFNLTVLNVAPTPTLSVPSIGLATQVLTFTAAANDPSPVDQAAGFAYSINWGDGSPVQGVPQTAGNGGGVSFSHSFASTGNHSVTLTATDKDGGVATVTPTVTVEDMTAANLQTVLSQQGSITTQVASDAQAQAVVAAVNGLQAQATPVTVTMNLGAGTYSDVTASPPAGVTLVINGSGATTTIVGHSPALDVTGGNVILSDATLTTATDAPTVLVSGGTLTLRNVVVQESSAFNQAAVSITGGSVDLGTADSPGGNTLNVNGPGELVHNTTANSVPAVGDAFEADGVALPGQALSFTTLTSSAASTLAGQSVTFTATVRANPAGSGTPTGSVDFQDVTSGADLGSMALSGGTATLSVSSLSAGSHTIRAVYSGDGAFTLSQDSLTQTVLVPASLSGLVFEDFNDDGQVDFGEAGIPGVTVTLSGADDLGNAVSRSQRTDANGAYLFANLRPGKYYLSETQPAGYTQGIDSVGTAGGSLAATDEFFVQLGAGVNGMNYNYGEQPPAGAAVQKGQTAGIGFWNNKNGQALILALNGGGASHELGDWLAATFVNLYGANSANDLAGKSNAYVAALFQQDFVQKGMKLDAQVLATALSVYVTNATLDPTQAAAKYGFTVGGDGVGTATFNVGSNGAAFGVANNTTMTVMDLLLATDDQAANGVLYNGDTVKRNEANSVYSALNQAGTIS